MPKPYEAADRSLKALNRLVLKRLDRVKRRLSTLKFDELNVLTETESLYREIGEECRKTFRDVYRERYTELWIWLKGREPDEDELDELIEMYLAGLWNEPDKLTHYAFGPELERKRDRAREAVISVPTKLQKQLELDKAVRYVAQQYGFYVDITEDRAGWQALKDAGVRKVRWNVYGDDKVCGTCNELDGKIFDIDRVPEHPHLRCRCFLSPVN